MQDETRIIYALWFGATYIREFTVLSVNTTVSPESLPIGNPSMSPQGVVSMEVDVGHVAHTAVFDMI